MPSPRIALLLLLLASTACGETVVVEDEGAGGAATTSAVSSTATAASTPQEPTALYVSGSDRCPVGAPAGEAEATMTPGDDPGLDPKLLVVELVFAEECTDAGGQHIVARAVDGGAMMWLGANDCSFFDAGLVDGRVHHGVAHVFEDDHSESLPDATCISFPGEDAPITSDLGVVAIAVFPSLQDAESFVAAIED